MKKFLCNLTKNLKTYKSQLFYQGVYLISDLRIPFYRNRNFLTTVKKNLIVTDFGYASEIYDITGVASVIITGKLFCHVLEYMVNCIDPVFCVNIASDALAAFNVTYAVLGYIVIGIVLA